MLRSAAPSIDPITRSSDSAPTRKAARTSQLAGGWQAGTTREPPAPGDGITTLLMSNRSLSQ
jgi:hypothetical protein